MGSSNVYIKREGIQLSKKEVSPQKTLRILVKEMIDEYSRWDDIKKNGCSDPFWSDGCNINLVRNHIIYYRNEIKILCTENLIHLPLEYSKPVPAEMPDNFMAVPDKIKKDAAEAYKIYSSTDVFEKLQDDVKNIKKEFQYIALNIIGYKISCRKMIASGDFIGMRRFYPERAQYDVKRAQELLQRRDIYEFSTQLSLF